MSLVHLHRHSEYSLLDGTGTADQYAEEAAKRGHTHLALTDHATLSGILHHIKACDKRGVIPICGVEAYFRPNRKNHTQENKEYWHMVLLAKDIRGWHSLLRITSEAYASGFYYKPCVDYELLEKNSEGLMLGTACVSGFLPDSIARGDDAARKEHLTNLQNIFGDDMFVEIMPHDFDEQRALNPELVNIANQLGVPYAATVDAHYPVREWADTQDVILMMATGQSLGERKAKEDKGEDVYKFDCQTLYLMDEQELSDLFVVNHPNLPAHVISQAIDNTQIIADSMTPFLVDKREKLPKVTGGEPAAYKILEEWCEEGMQRVAGLYAEDKAKGLIDYDFPEAAYRERLAHELRVLRDKNVCSYFVVIGDMVRWAKSVGIRVGAGRGSAAGSLVSFLSRITAIDPIAHGLLFERFLNPHREGLPDIDLDFQHNRRIEVKEYLQRRWGHTHVADIVAHQTFGMRASLQGVARTQDVPYEDVMKVTNTFDDRTGDLKLEDIYKLSKDLQEFAKKYPVVWKHALRIEGQIKAISKHAAGVVVTDKPIAEYMPTMRGNDGTTVTAWSQRAEFPIIDEYGFLKIDVLGTDGLTIQDTACKIINKQAGTEVVTHEYLDNLTVFPWRCEPDVLEAFGRDLTLGVFQFESRGIRGLLRNIKPTKFGDIAAANALYRPGPLEGGIAFDYGAIKNGERQVEYWHDAVEPALEETYGLMVYQEQVMQIAQALGDFSLAEAATLQKAMTKWQSTKLKDNKGRDAMNKFWEKFLEGCTKKGISVDAAKAIWDKVLQFSIYGFNKSHSAGYGAQAYQDMWLKLRHAIAFYASLLSHETQKVPQVVREAQARGTKILPPDINTSDREFTVDGDAIRFGFEGIKYVGDAAIAAIAEHKPYKSYDDFCERVPPRRCNAKVKNALVRCGAFDTWGMRTDLTIEERAAYEREFIGFALSTASRTQQWNSIIQPRITNEDEMEKLDEGDTVTLGGEVVDVRKIMTRKGDAMGFVDIAFGTQTWACTIWPRFWQKFAFLLQPGNAVMARGKMGDRGNVEVHTMCTLAELEAAIQNGN